ncbi:MAG: DNA polymerase III subunit beta [Clostridiales bacterium]|nr:DNA polymerase III subunit beta [Clostridiales bacterium]
MKFVCEGMTLSEAAFIVSKACAIRTMTPVLECIKIKAENDGLLLTAYDGEISIEKKIKAEVLEEGEICVNGRFFADFMGKISYNEVIINSDDKGIVVRYGDSETNIQTLPTDDFPIFNGEQISKEKYFEIKQNDLKELISKVTFCCATDESRPILKGCLLEAKEGKLYATALDGLRMASGFKETTDGGDMKIVCPARTLTEISRMLEGDETLKIYADKNRLSVEVNDTVITSRLYAGEFVRKENIYPINFASQVIVKKSELMQSIERAGVLTRGDKNNLVVFDIKSDKIVINANSDMGKIEETVNTELDGKELKIAMNGKYLLDAVKALTEENIVLSFNMPNSPFTIENEEDKCFQYLVMPMRTGNQ